MQKTIIFRNQTLNKYKIDEHGIIYYLDEPLDFNKYFTYGKYTLPIEKVMASSLLENPHKCRLVVFKDGDINNYHISNLTWSSVNQEYYNYLRDSPTESTGKYCRTCQIYKDYCHFDKRNNKYFLQDCKKCAYDRRQQKKDEYNKKRNNRRNMLPGKDLYYKKHYDKLKSDPIAYRAFLDKTRQYRIDNWKVEALSRLKSRAIKENLDFNLTKEDLVYPNICPILEIPIDVYHPNKENLVSWDRIIPELGYIKGNVRAISYKANAMKNNANRERLEIFVKNILNYIDGKI